MKIDLNDQNANDTDLDQTFNLNGSYEISPTKIESSFEIVDKVINCNGLVNDDENENEIKDEECKENKNENINHDDGYLNQAYESNTFVFMQTTTTIIADIQTNQEEEEPIIDQVNEENLTIIIPDELNKINSQNEEEIVEERDQLNEKNSESEVKVRTFFLTLINYVFQFILFIIYF